MISLLEKNRVVSVVFFVLIAMEIFAISSIPGSEIIGTGFNLALLYHFSVFFLLNFFLLTSLIGKKKISKKKLLVAIIFSLIYAILDEVHQFFVPSRTPAVSDVLVDFAGILTSCLIYLRYTLNKKRKRFNL